MIRFILLLSLSSLLLSSCVQISKDGVSWSFIENEGKGPIITKDYKDLQICGIEINNGIEAKLMKSNEEKVIVSAPSDIIDKIIVEQLEGRTINLRVKSNSNISTKKVRVEIYSKELCKIASSSAAEIEAVDEFSSPSLTFSASSGSVIKGKFRSKTITANTSSGAEIHADLSAIKLFLTSSSGSSMNMKGYSQDLKANASSGAEINGDQFYSQNANLSASSGGSINSASTKSVNANASSGSEITVLRHGNDFSIQKSVSSGGQILVK